MSSSDKAGWAAVLEDLDDVPPAAQAAPPPPPGPELRLAVVEPAPRPAPASRKRPTLALTLGAGAAALALAFALRPEPAPEPAARARPNPLPPAAVQPAAGPPPAPVRAPEAAAPANKRPMLSVMSQPPGAVVTLGDKVYGKTPLVMPSPDPHSLMLTLRRPGYQRWTAVIRPDEAGHFSVNATLEVAANEATPRPLPRRPRPAPRR